MFPIDASRIAAARKAGALTRDFCIHRARERHAVRHEQALRIDAVLRLCEQVGGDEIGACAVVGNHENLSDAGGQVRGGAGRVVRHL